MGSFFGSASSSLPNHTLRQPPCRVRLKVSALLLLSCCLRVSCWGVFPASLFCTRTPLHNGTQVNPSDHTVHPCLRALVTLPPGPRSHKGAQWLLSSMKGNGERPPPGFSKLNPSPCHCALSQLHSPFPQSLKWWWHLKAGLSSSRTCRVGTFPTPIALPSKPSWSFLLFRILHFGLSGRLSFRESWRTMFPRLRRTWPVSQGAPLPLFSLHVSTASSSAWGREPCQSPVPCASSAGPNCIHL